MLIIEALEQLNENLVVLRLEDLDEETIIRVAIDSDTLTDLVDRGDITIIEEFDISYDDDYED
jgi:hypothetical protein